MPPPACLHSLTGHTRGPPACLHSLTGRTLGTAAGLWRRWRWSPQQPPSRHSRRSRHSRTPTWPRHRPLHRQQRPSRRRLLQRVSSSRRGSQPATWLRRRLRRSRPRLCCQRTTCAACRLPRPRAIWWELLCLVSFPPRSPCFAWPALYDASRSPCAIMHRPLRSCPLHLREANALQLAALHAASAYAMRRRRLLMQSAHATCHALPCRCAHPPCRWSA